jgi:hypothetical protein
MERIKLGEEEICTESCMELNQGSRSQIHDR